MSKLKILSSEDIISALKSFGFQIAGQKGSHVKLSRQTSVQKQVLTIPDDRNLSKGTVKAIFNQASRFVSQDELKRYFYTD